jgi:hypothetical protein
MEKQASDQEPVINEERSRPFMLTLLSLFTLVFYGLFSLFFLLSVFYSRWLTDTINLYIPENTYAYATVLLLAITGFSLHAIAIAGIILMWRMNKKGYFLFGVPSLAIAAVHMALPQKAILSLIIYISLVILFGLFFRRFR